MPCKPSTRAQERLSSMTKKIAIIGGGASGIFAAIRCAEVAKINNTKIEIKVFETSKDSLVSKHNNAINSCIACHETTCVGPIPRIKKLLIK